MTHCKHVPYVPGSQPAPACARALHEESAEGVGDGVPRFASKQHHGHVAWLQLKPSQQRYECMSFGSFSLRELTCRHCVYLTLWTRKGLCGSFSWAVYKFSFIFHLFIFFIFFHSWFFSADVGKKVDHALTTHLLQTVIKLILFVANFYLHSLSMNQFQSSWWQFWSKMTFKTS